MTDEDAYIESLQPGERTPKREVAFAGPNGSPTAEDFDRCLHVLRWIRDYDDGLHESWRIPITHICGVVRGCIEIATRCKEHAMAESENAELSGGKSL